MEGRTFGDVPLNVELKLEVWDSPNSAGVVIDAVRCCKLAMDNGISGAIEGPSAYFMKSPPVQYADSVARQMTEDYITGNRQQATGNSAETTSKRPEASEERVEGVAREQWRNYVAYMRDFAAIPHSAGTETEHLFAAAEGWEHIVQGMNEGHGVVLVSAHFGNWDLSAGAMARHYPVNVIADTFS